MKFSAHLLLSGMLLLAGASHAQTHLPPRRPGTTPQRAAPVALMTKDGVTRKDGRLLLTEMGHTVPLDQNKKLLNGTLISTAGVVTHPDGTTETINEGDQVSLTGRLVTRQTMATEDSVRKLVAYDLKHPGKREQMEEAQEKADKRKEKLEKEKEKAAEEKADKEKDRLAKAKSRAAADKARAEKARKDKAHH